MSTVTFATIYGDTESKRIHTFPSDGSITETPRPLCRILSVRFKTIRSKRRPSAVIVSEVMILVTIS